MSNCPICFRYNHNTEPVYYWECEKQLLKPNNFMATPVTEYAPAGISIISAQWDTGWEKSYDHPIHYLKAGENTTLARVEWQAKRNMKGNYAWYAYVFDDCAPFESLEEAKGFCVNQLTEGTRYKVVEINYPKLPDVISKIKQEGV